MDLAAQCDFGQLVNEPTRGENILDLLLTNDPSCVSSVDVSAPIGNSDHGSISFKMCCGVHKNEKISVLEISVKLSTRRLLCT